MIRLAVFSLLLSTGLHAETIDGARYAEPVLRYGHFALGRPHEYGSLQVRTSTGRSLELKLAPDEVFEDLAPRLVRLVQGAAPQLLTIVSHREQGARLVLYRLDDDGSLRRAAQSTPIGTPNRWLNPVAVADLDGDGQAEVAAVVTPHIGGTLKVYRRRGEQLVEFAALGGFSNHVYGSPELALSTSMEVAGQVRLLVPDQARTSLRIISLVGGQLVESGRCSLAGPLEGPLQVLSDSTVSVGLGKGAVSLRPASCLR